MRPRGRAGRLDPFEGTESLCPSEGAEGLVLPSQEEVPASFPRDDIASSGEDGAFTREDDAAFGRDDDTFDRDDESFGREDEALDRDDRPSERRVSEDGCFRAKLVGEDVEASVVERKRSGSPMSMESRKIDVCSECDEVEASEEGGRLERS